MKHDIVAIISSYTDTKLQISATSLALLQMTILQRSDKQEGKHIRNDTIMICTGTKRTLVTPHPRIFFEKTLPRPEDAVPNGHHMRYNGKRPRV